MELSVMSPALNAMDLDEALAYLHSLGVDSIELGAGGYPGKAHLNPAKILHSPQKIDEIRGMLDKHNMKISAIAYHGNPVYPNKEIAKTAHNEFVEAMKVAVKLGVTTIIGFSGCPGDCIESQNPN